MTDEKKPEKPEKIDVKEPLGALMYHELWRAFRHFIALVAGVTFLWNVFEPEERAREWVDSFLDPITKELDSLKQEIAEVRREVGSRPPFIELNGIGRVMRPGPFKPGEVVPIFYNVRRNRPCTTVVRVQFFSSETGRVQTDLSYSITADQAPASFDFIPFPVTVALPDDMPSGSFAYAPVLIPDRGECPDARPVTPAHSQFFTVENPND